MTHHATCSWDGSHQREDGKVELALFRPLFDAYRRLRGAAALEALQEMGGLRPEDCRLYDVWMGPEHVARLLQAAQAALGGPASFARFCRHLDVYSLAPVESVSGGWPERAAAFLRRFQAMQAGSQLEFFRRSPFHADVLFIPVASESEALADYREALLRSLFRAVQLWPSRWRAEGPGRPSRGRLWTLPSRRWNQALSSLAALLLLGSAVWSFAHAFHPLNQSFAGWLGGLAALLLLAWGIRLRGGRAQAERESAVLRQNQGLLTGYLRSLQRVHGLVTGGQSEGLVLVSPRGQIDFVSQGMVSILGLSQRGWDPANLERLLRPLILKAEGLPSGGSAAVSIRPETGEAREAMLYADRMPGRPELLLRVRPLDAAEREREEALERAALLATLIDHGQECVLIVNRDGTVRYVTPNLNRLFGLEPAVLLGGRLDPILDPADVEAVHALLRGLREDGGVSLRLRVRHGGGSWRWVQASIENRQNQAEINGFLFQLRDVTQLMEFEAAMHESEDSLRRSEAFYRMIIEGSSDLLFLLDERRRIIFANPALGQLLGYQLPDVSGRELLDFVHPEDRAATVDALARTERLGRATARVRGLHRDGSSRLFEAQSRHTVDPDHRPIFVVSARDISREDALEKRTIQENRLEAIGRLAGGVAHDFNNLLTVIQGNSELALSEGAGPVEKRLREIMEASHRAGQLVQQLLTFGRVQPQRIRPLDITQLIKENEGFLRRVLGAGIRFRVRLPEEDLALKADALSLSRSLLNLAANAKDAMPDGGVLSLSCDPYTVTEEEADSHPDRAPGDYVRLEMADTGTGMDEKTLAHIFEPFFTTRGKGTGLGLSMVFGAVRQAGGFVSVISRPGEGTVVSLFLPRVPFGEVAREAPAQPSKPGLLSKERRILLADDEPGIRLLAAEGLKLAGYEVLEAADGEEALALWREARHNHVPIDLVLSDVGMPRMNGLQLREQIHQSDPHQKVLLMSGFYETKGDQLELDTPVVAKPFTVNTLKEAVAKSFQ